MSVGLENLLHNKEGGLQEVWKEQNGKDRAIRLAKFNERTLFLGKKSSPRSKGKNYRARDILKTRRFDERRNRTQSMNDGL
jgi:hypothetical protein